MRNWLKTFLFVSACSPALITMSYVRYDIYGWSNEVFQLLIFGLLGSIIPIIVIQLVKDQGESLYIQAKKIESNDFMLLAFVIGYLLPLILKGAELSMDTIVVILMIIGVLLWLISSLPAHPLLRFFKFKFYKLESSTGMVYTLISKREIRDPREIKSVKKLSETMLMEDETSV